MSFISRNAVGVGTTTVEGRDAGIGTAVGTLVYTVGDVIAGGGGQLEIYTDNNEWKAISTERASTDQINYFGDQSDGAFNSSGTTSLTVTNKNGSFDGDMMVRQHTSFTLNSGHSYTVDQPCRGLVIFATGDVTINGTLDMTARGAYADTVDNSTNPNSNIPANVPANGLIWKFAGPGSRSLSAGPTDLDGAGPPSGAILTWLSEHNLGIDGTTGSEIRLSRQGAAGGAGAAGSPNVGRPGSNGTAGTNTVSSDLYTMQTGGGGGGGNGAWSGSVPAGSGSFGSCFGGGSGGGGNRSENPLDAGMNATEWGGAGGFGDNGGSFNFCGAGGAGNPGGAANEGAGTASPGEAGTGGLVVIVAKGNVTVGPGGSITANGKNGGNASGHPDPNRVESAGGGSGGGIILIAHGGTYTNNGSVTANGGSGGTAPSNSGGAGGNGAIRTIPITAG